MARKKPGACDAAQMKENKARAGYDRTVQGCFNHGCTLQSLESFKGTLQPDT